MFLFFRIQVSDRVVVDTVSREGSDPFVDCLSFCGGHFVAVVEKKGIPLVKRIKRNSRLVKGGFLAGLGLADVFQNLLVWRTIVIEHQLVRGCASGLVNRVPVRGNGFDESRTECPLLAG